MRRTENGMIFADNLSEMRLQKRLETIPAPDRYGRLFPSGAVEKRSHLNRYR